MTDANVKPADPDEAGGDDNPCRRSDCAKLAAELDEARNRFKQTAQKLNAKLEKAERSAHAETERAGEMANRNNELAKQRTEGEVAFRGRSIGGRQPAHQRSKRSRRCSRTADAGRDRAVGRIALRSEEED